VEDLISQKGLMGVADEASLANSSQVLLSRLTSELESEITAKKILEEAKERLNLRCFTDTTSFYALLLETNRKRSQLSCDALARKSYSKFRTLIRDEATTTTKEGFTTGVSQVEETFRAKARGPAVEETVNAFLNEQAEADRVFLDKVHSINDLYKETLEVKMELDKTIQIKQEEVETLGKNLIETTNNHKQEVEQLRFETKEEMEQLSAGHDRALDQAMAEQQSIQTKQLDALTNTMNEKQEILKADRSKQLKRKQAEIETLKTTAEAEIQAREERMDQAERAHEDQVKQLLRVADEKMKAEILVSEEKRKADQRGFREEMVNKLKASQDTMKDEISKREERLRQEEERHTQELERTKKNLETKMEAERSKYLSEIKQLERRCFPCGGECAMS
jgi:hypothetical protein